MKNIIASVIVAIALVISSMALAGASPVAKQVSGSFAGSTSSTGYVTVPHDLGVMANQVFVSFTLPYLANYKVTNKTATNFQIQVMRPYDNNPYNGPVAFDWQALANPSSAPLGSSGTFTQTFADNFDGTVLDTSKWTINSSSQSCNGTDASGNQGNNQQLELNRKANLSFANGVMTITAKREEIASPCGGYTYAWTSGLITTGDKFTFQTGWIEERVKFPANKGFWPAFWTWQAPGVNSWDETDVYEYYSDNKTRIYSTKHPTGGGIITILNDGKAPDFDPSADFHVYGADIKTTSVDFYIDGIKVGSTTAGAAVRTSLISNLAVYSVIPPDTLSAQKQVDYIKVWIK